MEQTSVTLFSTGKSTVGRPVKICLSTKLLNQLLNATSLDTFATVVESHFWKGCLEITEWNNRSWGRHKETNNSRPIHSKNVHGPFMITKLPKLQQFLERFWYFCIFLYSSHCYGVGGAQLEKDNVMCLRAPIRILQYLILWHWWGCSLMPQSHDTRGKTRNPPVSLTSSNKLNV